MQGVRVGPKIRPYCLLDLRPVMGQLGHERVEDEGSRTPGDTVERLLHLARELIELRCDVIFATRVRGLVDALLTLQVTGAGRGRRSTIVTGPHHESHNDQ